MKRTNLMRALLLVQGLMMFFSVAYSQPFTNPIDANAINKLYARLGYPPLHGWIAVGGDPCFGDWEGVRCTGGNITELYLSAENLGADLGDALKDFIAIETIDLSHNYISGSIPDLLPRTLRTLLLKDNLLTGNIPESFSELSLLSDLDLSSNKLSGQLPQSMKNLSSLETLHLQNNRLSGKVDVLQDLPLKDLNIENNLFSGPIPVKMLGIPIFRKDGNSFRSAHALSPSALTARRALSPSALTARHALSPSALTAAGIDSFNDAVPTISNGGSHHHGERMSILKAIGYAAVASVSAIGIALLLRFIYLYWRERSYELDV